MHPIIHIVVICKTVILTASMRLELYWMPKDQGEGVLNQKAQFFDFINEIEDIQAVPTKKPQISSAVNPEWNLFQTIP